MRRLIGTLGRLMVVAVVAVLIGGCLAAPAAARSRDDGTQDANDMIEGCVGMGGSPEVLEANEEFIEVACKFTDGSQLNCSWYVGNDWSTNCYLQSRTVPGGSLLIVDPGNLPTLQPVANEPVPVSPPAAAPDDDQDDERVAKPKKKKQAKKAKKGKGKGKNGEPKQRGKSRGRR